MHRVWSPAFVVGRQNTSPSLKWNNKTNLNLYGYIITFRDGPQQPINSIFIYIAQNHNHIASVGFTICTLNPRLEWGKIKTKPFNREEVKDGRNLTKSQFALTEYLIQMIYICQWEHPRATTVNILALELTYNVLTNLQWSLRRRRSLRRLQRWFTAALTRMMKQGLFMWAFNSCPVCLAMS